MSTFSTGYGKRYLRHANFHNINQNMLNVKGKKWLHGVLKIQQEVPSA